MPNVTVNWTAPADGAPAAFYKVSLAVNGGTPVVATPNGDATSHTFTVPSVSGTLTATVQAFASSGVGGPVSDAATLDVQAPGKPGSVTIEI